LAGVALIISADTIANKWLQSTTITTSEVRSSIELMTASIVCRWMSGLYRGILGGFEQSVWLSKANIIIATIRFIGVVVVLKYINNSPGTFFIYQALIAIFELSILRIKTKKFMPKMGKRVKVDLPVLIPKLKFSGAIAFTSTIWILLTQTDKLILSKLLSLEDFGYFTLAVLVASTIMVIGGPVSSALMPRLTKLHEMGLQDELIQKYRDTTQFVAVFAGSVSTTIAFNSELLLHAWTGNAIIVEKAAPILSLYALGNGLLVLAAFPYYLQYAKGNLKFHLMGNIIFVILYLPILMIASTKYLMIGAAYAWLIMQILTFILWVPYVHYKISPGLNNKWYLEDVLTIILPLLAGNYFLSLINFSSDNIFFQFGYLISLGISSLIIGAFCSTSFRRLIKSKYTNT
jgi:O-antigen/teichoic acid export membrane protein